MTSQFADMKSSSDFFNVVVFFLSSLVTDPSFMSISLLVLELWKFPQIRYWPGIRKSEILPPPSESLPISGDWDKLGIPNLAGLSLMKSYRMLQNVMVTAFTVAEVLRENPKRRGWGWGGRGMNEIIPPHTHTHTHTEIRVKWQ